MVISWSYRQCFTEGRKGRWQEDEQGFHTRTKLPSLLEYAVLEVGIEQDFGRRRCLFCTGSHQTCRGRDGAGGRGERLSSPHEQQWPRDSWGPGCRLHTVSAVQGGRSSSSSRVLQPAWSWCGHLEIGAGGKPERAQWQETNLFIAPFYCASFCLWFKMPFAVSIPMKPAFISKLPHSFLGGVFDRKRWNRNFPHTRKNSVCNLDVFQDFPSPSAP